LALTGGAASIMTRVIRSELIKLAKTLRPTGCLVAPSHWWPLPFRSRWPSGRSRPPPTSSPSSPSPLPSPVPPLPDQLPPALAATGPSWAPSTVARGTPPCSGHGEREKGLEPSTSSLEVTRWYSNSGSLERGFGALDSSFITRVAGSMTRTGAAENLDSCPVVSEAHSVGWYRRPKAPRRTAESEALHGRSPWEGRD
jgi:hypothetical protein